MLMMLLVVDFDVLYLTKGRQGSCVCDTISDNRCRFSDTAPGTDPGKNACECDNVRVISDNAPDNHLENFRHREPQRRQTLLIFQTSVRQQKHENPKLVFRGSDSIPDS